VKLLTLARDLRRRKARERENLFVAEGIRTVRELLGSPIGVRGVLLSSELSPAARPPLEQAIERRGIPSLELSERDFASAADTESPQGVLAIGEIPERSAAALTLGQSARLLLLDALQDPGNVGTILRTAAALGVDATVALPGTVDLWNAKVVRSAMGALFHHPAFSSTWADLATFLDRERFELWAADGAGRPPHELSAWPDRLALAVGNEGGGLSAESRARAARLVGLPISPTVESLNVAVATGILLYELRPFP
jgi:TrmH family RNA methyltransferase